MTGRFTRKSYSIWDNVKNEEFYELHYRYEVDDMCRILNNYEEKVKSLEKENEELKQEMGDLGTAHAEEINKIEDGFDDEILKLEKENEQLKSTIKEVTELLSEEVDLFSDKATEHDINAYVELKELDNKDAYYMATATKKAIKMLKELKK